jgi:hypothetical protein
MAKRTRRSNILLVFALIGLGAGAVIGFMTRPQTAEIRIGPLNIEVRGQNIARADEGLTSGQVQHIAVVALIGAAIGLGLGFAVQRGKIRL